MSITSYFYMYKLREEKNKNKSWASDKINRKKNENAYRIIMHDKIKKPNMIDTHAVQCRAQDTWEWLGHSVSRAWWPLIIQVPNQLKPWENEKMNQITVDVHHAVLWTWQNKGSGEIGNRNHRDGTEQWICGALKERVYTSVVLLTIICCRRNEGGKDQFS